MTKFSSNQALTYKTATGLWPHQAAGLRRVYVGRGRRRLELTGLYNGAEAGLDVDAGRWSTVCERHHAVCSHETLALANSHLVDPQGWCEECAGNAEHAARWESLR